MNQLAETALSYAENGWLVFPLKPRDKKPITPRGFKDASCDPAAVRAWWRDEPKANIGVVTGRANGIVVIDFDPKNGADVRTFCEEYADALRGLRFGRVATGSGGQHWYFAYPEQDFPSCIGLLPGVDVKSDGGYVLAPPSIHPGGGAYVWLE